MHDTFGTVASQDYIWLPYLAHNLAEIVAKNEFQFRLVTGTSVSAITAQVTLGRSLTETRRSLLGRFPPTEQRHICIHKWQLWCVWHFTTVEGCVKKASFSCDGHLLRCSVNIWRTLIEDMKAKQLCCCMCLRTQLLSHLSPLTLMRCTRMHPQFRVSANL